jgi:hypothetical protein
VQCGPHALQAGDAAFIEDESALAVQSAAGAELLLFDLRPA